MTIKTTFIFVLTSTLLACGQQTVNKHPSLTNSKENLYVDTVLNDQEKTTISPLQQELNHALNDSKIDNYYKEIYKLEKLISTEEVKMLSIAENLFTKDKSKDLFFFIVFTKSMNGSDGFYSEEVGRSALEFLTSNTSSFADYFNIAPKLNDNDMDNWAQAIYGELQISRENETTKAINELEKKLLQNINAERMEYEVIIKIFMKKVKARCPNSA